MKVTSYSRLGYFASLLIAWSGTTCDVKASFFKPAANEQEQVVEMTPGIEAAQHRVDESKAKLDQSRLQLDAARASLKAADAEYRAAKADKEALTLRSQADKLANDSKQFGSGPSKLSQANCQAPSRIDAGSGAGYAGAPAPSQSVDQTGELGQSIVEEANTGTRENLAPQGIR